MRWCLSLFTLISIFILPFSVLASPVYPGDPDAASKQWYLQKIEAYEAWSKTKGSENVVVAVIDTGVDLNHFDLKDNLWINSGERLDGKDNDGNIYIDDINGWDFVDGDNDPSPSINEPDARPQAIHHGTLVAGFLGAAGNNGIGGAGVAWRVKIMPLRALDSRGRGNVATVEEAIKYAVAKGANIINLSFVGPGFDTQLFLTLKDALNRGVLVVAAVGNNEITNGGGLDLDGAPLYPVCYTGSSGEDVVLGVAAVDEQDKKSAFSNYGANCVDISAPGNNMYGPQYYRPSQGFIDVFGNGWAGSSMAAPLVSGTAALIKALNPSYRAQEIRNILLQSADPIDSANPAFSGKLGKGRLNARRALELAATGGSSIFGPSSGVSYVMGAAFSGGQSTVRVLTPSGVLSRDFLAFPEQFKGGARLASGDVDNDGVSEIMVGAGAGGSPQVRVFAPDGTLEHSFLAYSAGFRGGVNVAVGDVSGDGVAEIVTGAGAGGGPNIRVLNAQGKALSSFFAYDKYLRGGVNVSVADIDKDGVSEIIASPGRGAGYRGEIKIFDLRGRLKRKFSAYPATLIGGITTSAGDLDGDGAAEIVTALAAGALPEVRVYSADGSWQRAFLAYSDAFRGGVNLAVGDLDRDGQAEIIAGPGKGGGPHLVVFDGFGRLKSQFTVLDKAFRGGLSVGIIKL